jgi:hypothetical protein
MFRIIGNRRDLLVVCLLWPFIILSLHCTQTHTHTLQLQSRSRVYLILMHISGQSYQRGFCKCSKTQTFHPLGLNFRIQVSSLHSSSLSATCTVLYRETGNEKLPRMQTSHIARKINCTRALAETARQALFSLISQALWAHTFNVSISSAVNG